MYEDMSTPLPLPPSPTEPDASPSLPSELPDPPSANDRDGHSAQLKELGKDSSMIALVAAGRYTYQDIS